MDKLLELLALHGPSGDEARVADWLDAELVGIPDVVSARIGDNVVAVRGRPRTAIFAHTDTVGWTLGYGDRLIPIGHPSPRNGDALCSSDGLIGRLRTGDSPTLRRTRSSDGPKAAAAPGTRWTYDRTPIIAKGILTAAGLDNRAGVWASLEALRQCENIAVAFTTGEEQHGHGARVCADWLFHERAITQALIADITWHTKDTPCGKGVVVSLRDAFCPRQSYLDRVLRLAQESGIPFQAEIQSAGSSDGGHLLRSSLPIDWVFVGAPSKKPHTSREKIHLADLTAMADLLTHLVNNL
jgi:putative aminopeptidase FrvX